MFRQGMSQAHALRHSHKSEPCVHRESPTGRVIIVIVAEREDKRREKGEREDKRAESREREGEKERARKTESKKIREGGKHFSVPNRTTPHKTTPHHTTPHNVDSKRLRVCVQDASVCTGKTPACPTWILVI